MNIFYNITAENPKKLVKPVAYTTLAYCLGLIPFILLVEAARLIFDPFVHPGSQLDITRLWWVCGTMGAALFLPCMVLKYQPIVPSAMLKDAPIILLDEATASLDPENEAEIQQAINRLIEHRTVIAIAHKLKTVMNADHIIVLEEGRVVERGRHDDLLAQRGLYARLWKLQSETSDWRLSSRIATST